MYKSLLLYLFIGLLGFTSCKTKEKLVYFQSGSLDSLEAAGNYTPVFKTDDLLSIMITAEAMETVAPFNMAAANAPMNMNNGYTSGNAERGGYLIDTEGAISMPIIGEIEIAGLNRMEATELITSKLKEYVDQPIVQIQILNYKVSVLGDVQRPGTFKVPNERFTLLEAIGLAGDLNITGNRKNVLVIRDDNGKKTEYRVDLTKKDFFASPVYYLAQNDVVYVEPSRAARSNSTMWKTSGTIFISTAALIITTVSVILK